MKQLLIENNLAILLDDDVYEAVHTYKWILSKRLPYLIKLPASWKGSRYLHRFVANEPGPSREVIFKDGHYLNCQRSNLFVGSRAECAAFRMLNPIPEAAARTSSSRGVIWDPSVHAWTLDYKGWPIVEVSQQHFPHEADAARHFDELVERYIECEWTKIYLARQDIEGRAEKLHFEAANLRLCKNVGWS